MIKLIMTLFRFIFITLLEVIVYCKVGDLLVEPESEQCSIVKRKCALAWLDACRLGDTPAVTSELEKVVVGKTTLIFFKVANINALF